MSKTTETLAAGMVTLMSGDCVRIMGQMAENTFDAAISDCPYHLQSITKRFAKTGRTDKTRTTCGPYQRHARGFMNSSADAGTVAFEVKTWERVLRVLKPGAFCLAFGGTRSYHRMACAIEDAGFEVRDCIQFLYGSGFPKSLDISKAIDKAGGVSPRDQAACAIGRKAAPAQLAWLWSGLFQVITIEQG